MSILNKKLLLEWQKIVVPNSPNKLVMSKKQLEESSIMQVNNTLKIIQDCVELVNNTVNPDVFFKRYKLLKEKAYHLKKFEPYVKFSGVLPTESFQNVLDMEPASTHAFIQRYAASIKKQADSLKTEKGKIKKYQLFYDSLTPFFDQVSQDDISYIEEKYREFLSSPISNVVKINETVQTDSETNKNTNNHIADITEKLSALRMASKDTKLAGELFVYIAAIFPPSELSSKANKILSQGFTRIEILAIAGELCKPATTPEELELISRIYYYAGAKYRNEAIYYYKKYIDIGAVCASTPCDILEINGIVVDQLKANRSATYQCLGECYEGEHRFDEALECFVEANKINPTSHLPVVKAANIYRKKNKLNKGLELLKNARYNPCFAPDKSALEILDRHIEDFERKIKKGYVYRPRAINK